MHQQEIWRSSRCTFMFADSVDAHERINAHSNILYVSEPLPRCVSQIFSLCHSKKIDWSLEDIIFQPLMLQVHGSLHKKTSGVSLCMLQLCMPHHIFVCSVNWPQCHNSHMPNRGALIPIKSKDYQYHTRYYIQYNTCPTFANLSIIENNKDNK